MKTFCTLEQHDMRQTVAVTAGLCAPRHALAHLHQLQQQQLVNHAASVFQPPIVYLQGLITGNLNISLIAFKAAKVMIPEKT
jgi:hypothetical protein